MLTFASEMKKWLSDIKEFLQYAGIICLSLLSALWLAVRGKKRS
jgi:hypothetical protein